MHQISNNFTFLSFQTGRIESALNHTNELLKEGMVLWLRTLIKLNPAQVSCHLTEFLARIRDTGNATLSHLLTDFSREQPGTIINPRRTYSQLTCLGSKWRVLSGFFARTWVLFPSVVNYVGEFQHARVRYLSTGHPTEFRKRVWFCGYFSFCVWPYRYFHRISTLRYLKGLFNIALF